jgi:hypothetical protein
MSLAGRNGIRASLVARSVVSDIACECSERDGADPSDAAAGTIIP